MQEQILLNQVKLNKTGAVFVFPFYRSIQYFVLNFYKKNRYNPLFFNMFS